ncbi:MAG: branched-chain amino acid ABC transporter substrate-binding protein [Planctomycetes bacterium]|nr:branched-chain amino acid ABC transporter substrate-binding protein [Planctomycetota bacterium]
MKKLLTAGLIAAALSGFCGCGSKPDTINLGVAGPLTGDQAKMGTDVLNGVTLAVEEWNAKGGVLGKKIVIVPRDDMAQEQQAQSVAKELAGEGVVGVVGHFNSGCTIPASVVYHDSNIPMITPSSTNPYVTDRNFANIFRVCGRDDQQGKVAADFAVGTLKTKRVAILHDKTQYGQGLADEFKKALGANAEVVYYGGFPKEELNFKPIISAVKETNPDLWFFGGIYNQAGPMVVQAREAGLTAVFMSGDGVIDPVFLKVAGVSAEGSYLTFSRDPVEVPTAKTFLDKYHKQYGEHGPYSIYAYDAANIILAAIQAAGTTDGAKVSEQIRKTAYDGSIGKVQFDAKGDLASSYYIIWVVKGGKFVAYESK